MAEKYNLYTSNAPEGVYTKVKENLEETETNIASTNTDNGEIKYVKVAGVNDAGEGPLSPPVKTTFIGKSQVELLSCFRSGYFLQFTKGNYADKKTLKKSINGVDYSEVLTDSSAVTSTMQENITGPVKYKSTSTTPDSTRDSSILDLPVPLQLLHIVIVSATYEMGQFSPPHSLASCVQLTEVPSGRKTKVSPI